MIVSLAVLTACTSSVSPSSQPTAPQATRTSGSIQGYVRRCGTDVSGGLGPVARWQATSIVAGSFALVWIRQYEDVSPHAFRGHPRLVAKVLALVKQGRRVTVTVPSSERGQVRLLYDPSSYTVENGSGRVTFEACTGDARSWGAATQYNGGIYVAQPMCLKLQIEVAGGPPTTVSAPFGLGERTCA